jgi:uncharacterized protein
MRSCRPRVLWRCGLLLGAIGLVSCDRLTTLIPSPSMTPSMAGAAPTVATIEPIASPQLQRLIRAAIGQIGVTLTYDPNYVAIAYPGGDVPIATGVCTDVVIRAFRAVDVDLQQLVHEDMAADFAAYPRDWGLSGTDPNIDHRRVPNLMRFLERQNKVLAQGKTAAEVKPGDLVTWDLGGGNWHIGLVSDRRARSGQLMIVHNVGQGTQLEDVLDRWPILGHYRYF